MSAEYGTVNTQDEETPLVAREVGEEHLTVKQKIHRFLREHHIHIARGWLIVIAITAVLTLSFHFALKDKHPKIPEDPQDGELVEMCVSERSWFVALMLSIFLGPFGMLCLKGLKKKSGVIIVILTIYFNLFIRC
jgi:hypothetical protein